MDPVIYVARILQKYQWVFFGFSKIDVFLENLTRLQHQKWRVGVTEVVLILFLTM